MKGYVDSSVILRRFLEEANALQSLDNVTWGITSQITKLECMRTLDRLHIRSLIDSKEFAYIRSRCLHLMTKMEIVQITDHLLAFAEASFSVPIGSLDSLHLSSAILWKKKNGEPITFMTHDKELALAATSQGFMVKGV